MTGASRDDIDGASASSKLVVELTLSDARRTRPFQLVTRILRPLAAVFTEGLAAAVPGLVVEVRWQHSGTIAVRHNWHDARAAAQADLEMIQRDLARLTVADFLSEYGVKQVRAQ